MIVRIVRIVAATAIESGTRGSDHVSGSQRIATVQVNVATVPSTS